MELIIVTFGLFWRWGLETDDLQMIILRSSYISHLFVNLLYFHFTKQFTLSLVLRFVHIRLIHVFHLFIYTVYLALKLPEISKFFRLFSACKQLLPCFNIGYGSYRPYLFPLFQLVPNTLIMQYNHFLSFTL